MTDAPEVVLDNGDGSETVVWCSRAGHPGPYAHTHPYISSLCANGDCAGCVVVGELSNAPDFCDHDCHTAVVPPSQADRQPHPDVTGSSAHTPSEACS